ncbi:MAG: 50S ribosomal protein L13 [Candidatus Taylorbacteria bacterium RIFCSPHIGHO2_01_FULL_46_22b]|uniref:50S ribosomal protein L13 n=1 Tax=Candidatus Taylorbacteria bacterium RIFCSPHIGHO2_01_FULL_46_22b TaxID=1802301 RepID=A0A1G2M181_9BACT|nr:MAG: 50S ribosomal protein L13 [Candidatus Taylorbacteria bacterium RIFCSPHIGHO2_01_FULL_46_22b]
MKNHVIDATNKRLGRIASEAAKIIMGKDRADFARNTIPEVTVVIENASKIDISEKKLSTKEYDNYSGYAGGRKVLTASQVVEKKGYSELFRKAVYGMLPTNRLRAKMIKHLIVKE